MTAEKLLFDLRQGYSGELMILRLAYVYGPGNLAVWRRPFQFLESGRLRLIGNVWFRQDYDLLLRATEQARASSNPEVYCSGSRRFSAEVGEFDAAFDVSV